MLFLPSITQMLKSTCKIRLVILVKKIIAVIVNMWFEFQQICKDFFTILHIFYNLFHRYFERLKCHLGFKSAVCRAATLLYCEPVSAAIADERRSQLRSINKDLSRCGKRRHFAQSPVVRMIGPPMHIDGVRGPKHNHLGCGGNDYFASPCE